MQERIGKHTPPSSGSMHHWIPEMSKGATATAVWPASGQTFGRYELPEGTVPEWGPGCGQLPLRTSRNDTDWPALHGAAVRCLRSWSESRGEERDGVCAVQGSAPLQCYQNHHCRDSGQVCSAWGRCVDGYVLMRNKGYSPWQVVPEFLPRHGMCGFREWFEYETIRARPPGAASPGTLAAVNPDVLWYSTIPYVTDAVVKQGLFERGILKEFYVQGYHTLGRKINRVQKDGSCIDSGNCLATPYQLQDGLFCGAAGYLKALDPSDVARRYDPICRVDPLVTPLVRMFCTADRASISSACDLDPSYATVSNVQELCRLWDEDYNYQSLPNIDRALNRALLRFFKRGFTTWDEYQRRATCAATVFNLMGVYAGQQTQGTGGTQWYSVELEPGVPTYFPPYASLYVFRDASQMEIPAAWWVQCVLLDSSVNVELLESASTDQVPCRGWENAKTAGYQPQTVRDFLLSSPRVYLESGMNSPTNETQIALSIYDNLFEQVSLARHTVQGAMGGGEHRLSYVYYRTLKDLYLTDEDYNEFANAVDSGGNSNNDKVFKTNAVPRDDGTYPFYDDSDIPGIFQQVVNYMMSGSVRDGYFPPGSGVNRLSKAMGSFTKTSLSDGFLDLGPAYFDPSLGVLQYTLPTLAPSFFEAELDRILAGVLKQEDDLQDWKDIGLEYEYDAFKDYATLADLSTGTMRMTKCLNVNFNTSEPGVNQNFIRPFVRLLDQNAGGEDIYVCDSDVGYDRRTGQSCGLMHDSLDDNCSTRFVYLREYNNGEGIVVQTHCKQPLFVRDLVEDDKRKIADLSRLDLDTANPAGAICLRTDSTCLQGGGLEGSSVGVVSVVPTLGVEVQTFYREMQSGDPNSDKFYGPLYQKASTRWYPAWAWTGWDRARVEQAREILLARENAEGSSPNLQVLDLEAIWNSSSTRPVSFSVRCNVSSCTTSTGVSFDCGSDGQCNVRMDNMAVHAMSLRLTEPSVYFCASSEAQARERCPARRTNDSVLVEIRNNLWYCKADCVRKTLLKYVGKHSIKYRGLREDVLGFTPSDRSAIGLSDTSNARDGYSQKDSFRLVHHLMRKQIFGSGNALPGSIYNSVWMKPSALSASFMDRHSLYPFQALTLYDYVNYVEQADTMRKQPLDTCINQAVDVTECSKDQITGQRVHRSSLEQCASELKRRSSLVANPGYAVLVKLRGEELTSSHLLHWAAASRPERDRFVDWVTSAGRCSETRQSEAVCYLTGDGNVFTINPWLGGGFNIHEACDTVPLPEQLTRVISADCFPQGSGTCRNYTALVYTPCVSKNNQPPSRTDIFTSASNNLCEKAPRPNSTCLQRQGLYGGGEGEGMTDLYTRPLYSMPYSGIFGMEPNPSYHSRTPSNGILRQSFMDLGGGFFVADLQTLEDGMTDNLLPACMPLWYPTKADGSPDLAGRDPCSNNSMDWLSSYSVDSRVDYDLNRVDLGNTVAEGQLPPWDCPVREMHFWGGGDASFRPRAPYGPRAGVMFFEASNMGGSAGNGMSNPVQPYGVEMPGLQRPYFASEICSCSSAGDCSFQVVSKESCSILSTVDFLSGEKWYTQQAHAGAAGCRTSTDWPHSGGMLRDGTYLTASAQDCPVHDRLREFQLRYIPVQVTADAGRTTLDEGGECHMGRMVSVPSTVPLGGQCHRYNYSHLECSVTAISGGEGAVTEVSYHHLDVPRSTMYLEQLSRNFRRRCGQCQAPPKTEKFVNRADRSIHGVSYLADGRFTSFGVPVRLSLARMLARDIRQQVCGNQAQCSLLDSVANTNEWTIDNFMGKYLRDIAGLFTSGGAAGSITPPAPSLVDDTMFWGRNWTFCTETERNLTTGQYRRECFGSIPKDTWMHPSLRSPSCKSAMLSSTPTRAAMIPVRICTLDATMNDLCIRIGDFIQRIQAANCKAAGVCSDQKFLYNPAAYSISNQQFITETVLDFYESVSAGVCAASYTTGMVAEVIAQNNVMRGKCPAQMLVPVQTTISQLRQVVQTLVKLAYYVAMIVINFLRLVTGLPSNEVMPDVFRWLDLFINEAKVLFDQLGNMLFGIIQATPFGEQLMIIIRIICTLLNWFIMYFWLPVMCPILQGVGHVSLFIANILKGIAEICILGICPFEWITYQIPLKVGEMLVGMDCTPREVLDCNIGDNYQPSAGDGTLPTPTRCWASYLSSVADSGKLSCSGADTCARGLTSDNADTVVCDACPFGADVTVTNRFGCDPIRKQCSCNVQQISQTPCMTHEQCINQAGATCVFMNSRVEQTFGNIPCGQCTSQPMCVIQPGQTYGSCSCFLTKVVPESCSVSEVGMNVQYKLSGLCLAQVSGSMGGFTAETSSTYTISYNNLLATPCYNADSSRIYCYSVYSSAFSYAPMLVSLGVSGLSGSGSQSPYGRRLLGIEGAPDFFSHDELCMDAWDDFLATNRSTRVMAGCVTRFAATYDVVSAHGLLDYIPPNMFVSWADFLTTVGDRPDSLLVLLYSPGLAFELLLRTPLYHRLVRHYRAWTAALTELYLDVTVHRRIQPNGGLHYEVDAEGGVFIHGHNISEFTLILLNLLHRFNLSANTLYPGNVSLAIRNQESVRKLLSMTATSPLATELLYNGTGIQERLSRRHLLMFTSWKTRMEEVQRFTGTVALNDGVPMAVGRETAADWVDSPFAWPLQFDFGGTIFECPLLARTFELTRDAFTNTSLYYANGHTLKATPRSIVSGSWPFSNLPYRGPVPPLKEPARQTFLNMLVFRALQWIDQTPFNRQFFYDLFSALPGMLRDFARCDRQAVMLCSRHHYTLLVSGFVIAVVWSGVSLVASSFRIPYLTTFLWMVPTCIFQDFVEVLNFFFPATLRFPDSLQKSPGCLDAAPNATARKDCLLSCSLQPFEYVSWESEVAWWTCFASTGLCRSVDGVVTSMPLLNKLTSLHRDLVVKAAIVEGENADMILAQSVCAALNVWRVIPIVILLFIVMYAFSVIATFPFFVVNEFVRLAIQGVIMSHTD
ncbi:hypothetical protein GUITHDRAFT_117652 [Guillardia theta CCMP2712]|uniref:Uncharacterized protein n=1 Tax=Guillardia theta (strain CCMP2712) TaxID=905079 RepID=L1IJN7_GUITC|nr:hypothetical protein GUITHDRAFT_117652 [Guillardia theta CCMP2712]EKX36144.1 hypothetical protein GUITHDRAFT_117652 [Guillardia theta CCMP2712]|eukprot:XP_005823124.1 hypothetical protein GUITHDRAFT_117652 [Guillardia theta CCMP2712]